MTKRHFLLTPLLLGGLLAGTLSASPIEGAFKLNGSFIVTPSTISWLSANPPDLPELFNIGLVPATAGSFAVLVDGSLQTIHNLDIGSQPVGDLPIPFTFIEFSNVTLPDLVLTRIVPGNGGLAGCPPPGALTTPPQTCTPPNPGGSPFVLTNVDGGFFGLSSTAQFALSGVTSDGLSRWQGQFSATFVGQSFQEVLAQLGDTGSVSSAISATLVVQAAPAVPEPGTFALIGMGLLMATVAAKRLKKS